MVVPFALSIHTFINNVGAYVGFASIVGLALLVLLHFAQARETSTLRARLEEAGERIGMLESRLAQALRSAQSAARPGAAGAPTVTPAPIAVGARAGAVAAARRVPGAAAAAALVRSAPGAPMGMAAPALASATRMVRVIAPVPAPTTTPAPTPAPAITPAAVPATAGAVAATAQAGSLQESGAPDDTLLVAPATAAAARGNGHERTALVPPVAAAQDAAATSPPPSPPPRVQIQPDLSAGARRQLPPPRQPLPPPRRSLVRRLLPGLLGILIVAAVVAVLLTVVNGGPTPKTTGNHHGRSGRHGQAAAVHFHPSRVTVAVLNGTAVTHLAKDVSLKLGKVGYKPGTVANAAVQTHTDTTIGYLPGHQAAAIHVAKTLHVPKAAIVPADHDAIAMCSASATGGSASCSADVIVTVGTNLASVASTAGTG